MPYTCARLKMLSFPGAKGRRMQAAIALVMASAGLTLGTQTAQAETTCYQYDALGRVTHVLKVEGACPASLPEPGSQPSGAVITKYTYDAAGNRTLYQVAGASGAAGGVVVLPLNGFTIIPLSGY